MEEQQKKSAWRLWLLLVETALVLAIIGLLVATWLPGLIGMHPGRN